MAGPTDISTILSQAGRIEKMNQSPFVHGEANRQVVTEDEAQARLKRNRQVNENEKQQAIQTRDHGGRRRQESKKGSKRQAEEPEKDELVSESNHIIDVVV